MRAWAFLVILFAGAFAARTAYAGDRAYYVHVVELGREGASPEVTATYTAFMSALLGCDSREAACMQEHTSDDRAMETTSNIALHALPSAISTEQIEGVIANRAPSRRAFVSALDGSDLEGILVVKIDARGIVHVYTLRRNGRIAAHTRYRPSATAPNGNIVRSVMGPIYRAFVP